MENIASPFGLKTPGKRIGISVVLAIYVLLVAVKLAYVSTWEFEGYGPSYFTDELVYRMNSESIFSHQRYHSIQYPPLYPLTLSLAFFSKTHWYAWMLIINALISSAIVFPVWWISRRLLTPALALISVSISAVMPYHFIYPRMILSENLFLSIFLFAVYLVLRSEKQNWLADMVTGSAFALAYLTRYIFLVAIPVLLLVRWLSAGSSDATKRKGLFDQAHFGGLLAIFVGFVLAYLPWILYVHGSGYPLRGAFLGSVRPLVVAGAPSLGSLTMWASAYVSYAILVIAPWTLVILLYLLLVVTNESKTTSDEKAFLVLVIGLCATFLAISTYHSWRAQYNYPEPVYLIGRYLLPLTPLFCILGLLSFSKLHEFWDRRNVAPTVLCSLVSLALVYSAWGLLYRKKIWKLPPWFAHIVFNSPDSMVYKSGKATLFVLVLVSLMAVVLLAGQVTGRRINRCLLTCLILSAVGVQAISFFTVNRSMDFIGRQGLHPRLLARAFSEKLAIGSETITLINDLDAKDITNGLLWKGLVFWGLPGYKISIVSANPPPNRDRTARRYLLTGKLYSSPSPALSYKVGGREYYLYERWGS